MTTLELVLAKVLTGKVVHKDLRNALVKFVKFWCTTLPIMHFLVYYPESAFAVTHTCTIYIQMDAPPLMAFDAEGHAHSECSHWEGFPSILWDAMRV